MNKVLISVEKNTKERQIYLTFSYGDYSTEDYQITYKVNNTEGIITYKYNRSYYLISTQGQVYDRLKTGNFKCCIFLIDNNFVIAEFTNEVNFFRAKFTKNADFNHVVFNKILSSLNIKKSINLDFKHAIVDRIEFCYAKFSADNRETFLTIKDVVFKQNYQNKALKFHAQ